MRKLKSKKGNSIIVYGGYSFASSLIKNRLIDEFNLLLNPVAVSSGQPIFKDPENNFQLTLQNCKPFGCGTVLLGYASQK